MAYLVKRKLIVRGDKFAIVRDEVVVSAILAIELVVATVRQQVVAGC